MTGSEMEKGHSRGGLMCVGDTSVRAREGYQLTGRTGGGHMMPRIPQGEVNSLYSRISTECTHFPWNLYCQIITPSPTDDAFQEGAMNVGIFLALLVLTSLLCAAIFYKCRTGVVNQVFKI